MDRVVVVGTSLAGLRTAEALRQQGFGGTITMVGAEDELPYDKPPLSKAFLAGDLPVERLRLRRDDQLNALDLTWKLGSPATDLDLEQRVVTLGNGATVAFDLLAIATGVAARRLAGTEGRAGVYVIRSLADSLAIDADVRAGARTCVVIGGGFIGLEAACTLAARGVDVTVVEAAPAPLTRGLGAMLGERFVSHHRRLGIDVRCAVAIAELRYNSSDHVTAVELADGSLLSADIVIVGVGASPRTEWLMSSGLTIRDGVVCDETLLAARGVVAVGDVARFPHALLGEEVRIEHWTNAIEHGTHGAATLLADARGERGAAFTSVPFVWSDHSGAKLQVLGRMGPNDQIDIVWEGEQAHQFIAVASNGQRATAVIGVSQPKRVMSTRALLAARAPAAEVIAQLTA
jgi:3-phenylpropionate/trans-cinnamate dioxygenase ferredoxin reductase component